MVLILGSLQLGLIYGLLAIGIYISFRVLNIPDLTAEGSFTFGLVVSAMCASAGHPAIGIALGFIAGAAAGLVTGLLQTRCGIHPILSGILTMSGLHSINLFVSNEQPNISLIGAGTVFSKFREIAPMLSKDVANLLVALAFAAVFTALIIIFFKTRLGLSIRAAGDNEDMVRASSINVDSVKLTALAVSNAFIALSGAVITQYQGYADINSGSGMLVVGLASVIIGEVIIGKRGITSGFISAVIGSVVYRFIIALATQYSLFPAYMLKLVSAVIVAAALSIPSIKKYVALQRSKRGGFKSCSK